LTRSPVPFDRCKRGVSVPPACDSGIMESSRRDVHRGELEHVITMRTTTRRRFPLPEVGQFQIWREPLDNVEAQAEADVVFPARREKRTNTSGYSQTLQAPDGLTSGPFFSENASSGYTGMAYHQRDPNPQYQGGNPTLYQRPGQIQASLAQPPWHNAAIQEQITPRVNRISKLSLDLTGPLRHPSYAETATIAETASGVLTNLDGTMVQKEILQANPSFSTSPGRANRDLVQMMEEEYKSEAKNEEHNRDSVAPNKEDIVQRLQGEWYYMSHRYTGPTRQNRPMYKAKQKWEWELYPHGVSKKDGRLRVQIKQRGENPSYKSFPNTMAGLLGAAFFRDKEVIRLWQARSLVKSPKLNFHYDSLVLHRPALRSDQSFSPKYIPEVNPCTGMPYGFSDPPQTRLHTLNKHDLMSCWREKPDARSYGSMQYHTSTRPKRSAPIHINTLGSISVFPPVDDEKSTPSRGMRRSMNQKRMRRRSAPPSSPPATTSTGLRRASWCVTGDHFQCPKEATARLRQCLTCRLLGHKF